MIWVLSADSVALRPATCVSILVNWLFKRLKSPSRLFKSINRKNNTTNASKTISCFQWVNSLFMTLSYNNLIQRTSAICPEKVNPAACGVLVPKEGFEPSRALCSLRPERSASASSATSAFIVWYFILICQFVNLCDAFRQGFLKVENGQTAAGRCYPMSIRNYPLIRQIERFCPLLRLPQYRFGDIGGGGWGFVLPQFKFRYKVLGLSRNFKKAICFQVGNTIPLEHKLSTSIEHAIISSE